MRSNLKPQLSSSIPGTVKADTEVNSLLLQYVSEKSCGAMTKKRDPPTRYTFLRDTGGIRGAETRGGIYPPII